MRFKDRVDAGKQLADKLSEYEGRSVIYGLPRGGVVLAAEVAKKLKSPLDLILVRKIGHPASMEYAIGAIAEGGEPVFDEAARVGIDDVWLHRVVQMEMATNRDRKRRYFPPDYAVPDVAGKAAIIIDDGMATGYTMVAAVQLLKTRSPKEIIVAVPVASAKSVRILQAMADKVIVLADPPLFKGSVGAHYDEFEQVSDEEVMGLLKS